MCRSRCDVRIAAGCQDARVVGVCRRRRGRFRRAGCGRTVRYRSEALFGGFALEQQTGQSALRKLRDPRVRPCPRDCRGHVVHRCVRGRTVRPSDDGAGAARHQGVVASGRGDLRRRDDSTMACQRASGLRRGRSRRNRRSPDGYRPFILEAQAGRRKVGRCAVCMDPDRREGLGRPRPLLPGGACCRGPHDGRTDPQARSQ
jgi:hypothetical protein